MWRRHIWIAYKRHMGKHSKCSGPLCALRVINSWKSRVISVTLLVKVKGRISISSIRCEILKFVFTYNGQNRLNKKLKNQRRKNVCKNRLGFCADPQNIFLVVVWWCGGLVVWCGVVFVLL